MSMTFQVGLESIDGKVNRTISAKTSQKSCGGMKAINWVNIKHKWSHLNEIPFPQLARRGTIDVLLGADNRELMTTIKEIPGKRNEPSARLCPLGWTAIGRIDKEDLGGEHHTGLIRTFRIQQSEETSALQDDDLNDTLRKFWELEHVGILSAKPQFSPDEQAAWKKVSESRVFDGKRYQVAVPWKEERPRLVSNRPLAERRLQQVERKLAKDEKIATAYQQVIDEYLQKNYIRRIPSTERRSEAEWLLPHFPVIRPDRATTKVRIVFDASATYQGRSLNTETLPGPKLQNNLFDILVRFRKELVAFAGDVSQMYHQLVLQPVDRPFHRFLWRDLDSSREPETYEFQRFVFGGCYCPFCAQYVWQQHARDHKDQYPLAAEAVQKNCYMDDLMPSVKSVDEAKTMRKQITELGDKAGFHVRKWISHRPEVIEEIPEQDRAAEIDLSKAEFPVTKTLGVLWIAKEDKFSFRYSAPPNEFILTKRSVLKKTATIFDPLGLLSPFTVRGKLLMQEAWTEAVTWDEVLPLSLAKKWQTWFGELSDLARIKIPRCLKDSESNDERMTVHTFTDASEKAYAAAVYARYEFEDGSIGTRLITAKTRLEPLKALNIPRLELMGAVIGLRLTRQVCEGLGVKRNKATYWVDSCNVGYWIHGQSRNFKPFVAHRVGEIHEGSNPDQWRYVPRKLNPADHGTRGLTVEELIDNECWWHGPAFLSQGNDNWPEQRFIGATSETLEEVKAEVHERTNHPQPDNLNSFVINNREENQWRLDPIRFSKWYRTKPTNKLEIGLSPVRVRSWVYRFIDNCRKPVEQRTTGQLTPDELKRTGEGIIKKAQYDAFTEEIKALVSGKELPKKSSILTFTPMVTDGILRSNTRLRYSTDLPDETKGSDHSSKETSRDGTDFEIPSRNRRT